MKKFLIGLQTLFRTIFMDDFQPNTPVRKPNDRTQVTYFMVYYIQDAWNFASNNDGWVDEVTQVKNRKEFAVYINDFFKMNKDYTTITRIIKGKYNLDRLPTGKPMYYVPPHAKITETPIESDAA